MDVSVQIVNAFIDGDSGGNPAGVVLDAERFSLTQKQLIAARAGLSETAFVSPSRNADFKLEFFTPARQIAHCGHATVATFSYLHRLGKIRKPKTSKETIDGNRDIFIESGMAFMEQRAPHYIDPGLHGVGTDAVLYSLRLSHDDLLDGRPPVVVNTGNSFLVVPLTDSAAVAKAAANLDQINAISKKLDLIGYYLFAPDAKVAGRDAGTRMFAPRYGIAEESATGMAAGPLACYLHDKLEIRKNRFLIEQGHLMSPPSPSVITVRLDIEDGRIRGLTAGGKASVMQSITVHI